MSQATRQIMDANANGIRLKYTGPLVWRRYFHAPSKEFKGLDRIIPVANNIAIMKGEWGFELQLNGEKLRSIPEVGLYYYGGEDYLFIPNSEPLEINVVKSLLIDSKVVNNEITNLEQIPFEVFRHTHYRSKRLTSHCDYLHTNKNFVYIDFSFNATLIKDFPRDFKWNIFKTHVYAEGVMECCNLIDNHRIVSMGCVNNIHVGYIRMSKR